MIIIICIDSVMFDQPDHCVCVVRQQWAGQEEPRPQQSLMGAEARQAGVELLPHLTHPQRRPLRSAIR